MSTLKKLQISRLYAFFAAHKWLIFLIWSIWLTLEYYALGPYSYVRIHDWGDSILPMWMGSAQAFSHYGFSHWSAQAASGFDQLSALGPLFRTDTLLFFISPGWLAVGLTALIQRFIAGYFTYRLCRDCLKLGELPSLVAGLAYSLCFFYFQSGFAGEAGFPLILWSLERISQRKGPATYLFAALLGVFVLFSSSFALSIPFILVMALAWFVLVRRLYSLRFLSLFATFCTVLLAGEIPWIMAALAQSGISHRIDWTNTQESLLEALQSWNRGVFDSYTVLVILTGLGLSILGLGVSRLRGQGILLIGTLLGLLLISRGFFPNTLIWGFLGIAILAVAVLRPFARMLLMVLLLLGFCMSAAALSDAFIRLVSIGSLSSFQFDRFYLIAPFFAVVAGAYGLSLAHHSRVTLTDRGQQRMEFSAQAIMCIMFVCVLALGSIGIKYDHYQEGGRYAIIYQNPGLQRLATGADSGPFRVATVAYGLHPAYANAYGLETVDGYVTMYPLRYKQFWGKVIEPLTSVDQKWYDYFQGWGSRIYLFPPSNGDFSKIQEVPFSKYYNLNLLALANTKYVVSELPLSDENLKLVYSQPADSESHATGLLDRIRRPNPLYIYENELCMPRFFVCGSATVLGNEDEVLQAMAKADINTLRNSVFVSQEFVRNIDTSLLGLSHAEIEVEQYSPDQITLSVKTDGRGILVVSNNYSPYWVCKVNGVEKDIIPVYHTFIGVILDENSNRVVLEYRPPYWAFW